MFATIDLNFSSTDCHHPLKMFYLKSLSPTRLINDRSLFEEITTNLVEIICLAQTLLLLKINDKLVFNGFKDNTDNTSLYNISELNFFES